VLISLEHACRSSGAHLMAASPLQKAMQLLRYFRSVATRIGLNVLLQCVMAAAMRFTPPMHCHLLGGMYSRHCDHTVAHRHLHQDSVVIPVADEPLATSSWPSSDVRSRHRAATRTTSVHRLARSSRSNLGKVASSRCLNLTSQESFLVKLSQPTSSTNTPSRTALVSLAMQV
jgi:hypothetical protein